MPIDGRFHVFILSPTEQFSHVFHLHSTPFRATIMVNHPKTMKQLLKSSEPKDTKLGGGYRNAIPWLGERH